MAQAIARSYAVASGATLYAGRPAPGMSGALQLADMALSGGFGSNASALGGALQMDDVALSGGFVGLVYPPGWPTLAAGEFGNIGASTMASVAPTGWPASDAGGPFGNWSGGRFAADFGAAGGYVVHGSGHLTPGSPVWAGVWVFNLATGLWVGRNVPAAPLLERAPPTDYTDYWESTVSGTEGHTYAPHTYGGLVIQSAANGGGASGSLLRNFIPGGGAGNTKMVHRFDLSSETAPPTRVIDQILLDGTSGNYPATALDEARGGYWLASYTGRGPLRFVRFSDWAVINHGVETNVNGNQQLVYIPPPWDCLLAMGNGGPSEPDPDYMLFVCRIVGGVPQAWERVTHTGARVPDPRSGGCWSTLLQCVVAYGAAGSATVHKLTPPAPASLAGGTWTWTSETLTGVGGATPSRNAASDNGAWGRMVEDAPHRCMLWCDSVSQPLQAWRLAGM